MTFALSKRIALKILVIIVFAGVGLLLTGALSRSHSEIPHRTPTTYQLSPRFSHSEHVDHDNVTHYQRRDLIESKPNLLWLTLTHSSQSWGKHRAFVWTTERTFEDYLRLITAQVNVHTTSLALLTGSRDEYDTYKSVLQNYDFPIVHIILHPGYDQALTVDRGHRHDKAVQTRRRAELSKLRNYLMLKALKHEDHLLWLDADIYHLDPNIVERMIRHSNERMETGVITARCAGKGIDDYDRNAWRGTRQGPRGWDLNSEEIKAGESNKQGQLHVAELYKNTSDDDLIELTTVGATILYIRASLVRQGLNFPHQYVVGTRWGKDGWDGIESEGLCYMSRGLEGGIEVLSPMRYFTSVRSELKASFPNLRTTLAEEYDRTGSSLMYNSGFGNVRAATSRFSGVVLRSTMVGTSSPIFDFASAQPF